MDAFWRVTELSDGRSQWIVLILFMQKQSLFGSVISLRWQFVYGKMIQYYAKDSRIKKAKRLFSEMTHHMICHIGGTQRDVMMEYRDVLNAYLLAPLQQGDVGEREFGEL